MTYTRKNEPDHRTVTFELSWIEEPVAIISTESVPMLAMSRAISGDWSGVTSMLPLEFVEVLETASGDEFIEFMDKWAAESRRTKAEEETVDTLFSSIMSKLDLKDI